MGITESQSVHKTEGKSPSPGREEEPGQEEGGRDVERELSPARQTLGPNASLLSPGDGFLSSGTLPERLLLPVCLTRAPARSPSCICPHWSCCGEPDQRPTLRQGLGLRASHPKGHTLTPDADKS